jgi:hypothetical protein
MSYENPWTFRGEVFDGIEGYEAFVYIIRNKVTGKGYIGKKTLISRRTKKVAGKKKKTKQESTWRDYYGSSAELLADVDQYGKESFEREILHLCPNKGLANYLEAKEQFVRGVLESNNWYNGWIDVKVARSHVQTLNPNKIIPFTE